MTGNAIVLEKDTDLLIVCFEDGNLWLDIWGPNLIPSTVYITWEDNIDKILDFLLNDIYSGVKTVDSIITLAKSRSLLKLVEVELNNEKNEVSII